MKKPQKANYDVDPQIETGMIYVKVIKAASSTTGGVARRVCVHFQLNSCTNAVFPAGKNEPGLWANHRSFYKLWKAINRLKKPKFMFTVIRDPAKRSMSYYYHFTATKKSRTFFDGIQNITIPKGEPHDGEKLEKIKHQKDFQYHYVCLPLDEANFRNGGETVEQCLDRYDVVGLAERYDESMIMLRTKMIRMLGKDIPLSRFWYLSSKVASDRGGRNDGSGFKFVHHKPLAKESQPLQDYIANEFVAQNKNDYALIEVVNAKLDKFIKTMGKAKFASELALFKVQMKVASAVCGKNANNVVMQCYWNDNGCNYLCLDMVAKHLEKVDIDLFEVAQDLKGHSVVLQMRNMWSIIMDKMQAENPRPAVYNYLSKKRLL